MIHENALKSRKLGSVSLGAGELWFRILLLVDDNGNYPADPLVIYANGMRSKKGITVELVAEFLKELTEAELLEDYTVDEEDEAYIHVADFHRFQKFQSDRPVKVTYPLHPEGPRFMETGKPNLRNEDGSAVDTKRIQSVSAKETNSTELDTKRTPEVEVKSKDKAKAKESRLDSELEDSEEAEDLGDWPQFGRDFHRAAGGVKTFMKFEQNHEMYQELCRTWGGDKVHGVIVDWVELKGGREKTKRSEYAAKNFLQDAEALLQQKVDEEVDANGVPSAIACIPGITRISEKNMR